MFPEMLSPIWHFLLADLWQRKGSEGFACKAKITQSTRKNPVLKAYKADLLGTSEGF